MEASKKAKLLLSKQKLENADPELRQMFEAVETVSTVVYVRQQESRLILLNLQADMLSQMSTENVREVLADKRAELSVGLDANSGVVEAYERREREEMGREELLAETRKASPLAVNGW